MTTIISQYSTRANQNRFSNSNKRERHKKPAFSQNKTTAFHEKSANLQLNKSISKGKEPLTARQAKNDQLAFKGSFVNSEFAAEAKKLLKQTPETKPAKELMHKIKGVIKETNPLRTSLESNFAKHKLENETIKVFEPVWMKAVKSFADPPKYIKRSAHSLFGGKNFIKQVREKEDTITQLTGTWMEINKHEKDIDNLLNKDNLKKIQGFLQKDKKQELSHFLSKNNVGKLFSYSKGKEKGLLASDKTLRKEFEKHLSGDIDPKSAKNFENNLKKAYTNFVIKEKDLAKQGGYTPNYGNSEANLVARVVSGGIPGYFIANDFYNMKMLTTGDKKEAQKERNSKFKQEALRVGMYAEIGYVLNSAFQSLTNKSLAFAVGLTAASSIAANTISRMVTKRPVLPIKIKDIENNPQTKNAKKLKENNTQIKDSSKNILESYNNLKIPSKKVSFTGNPSKLVKNLEKGIKNIDEKALKALPHEMDIKTFEEGFKLVEKIHPDGAEKILNIVGKKMNHLNLPKNATLSQIKEVAVKNNNKVIIGENRAYRYGKNATSIVSAPLSLVKSIIRTPINIARKSQGKLPLEVSKPSKFHNEEFITKAFKWAKDAQKEANFEGPIEKASGDALFKMRAHYGNNLAKNHDTKVMNYSSSDLSTFTKLTGLISVPFLAVDAYNVTAAETKNQNEAQIAAHNRVVQDTARQGISLWFVKSVNEMTKGLMNSSLLGMAGAVSLNTLGYETATRAIVNQPIFPKSQEQMLNIQKKKIKKHNWFTKIMGKELKTDKNRHVATAALKPSENGFGNNTIDSSTNVSGLKNKFENSLNSTKATI